MKLILMGTNDFVVPVFDDLANKHDIIAVFTRAPKPMGRKHILTPSPVHQWADKRGLKIHTSIKEFDSVDDKPDMIVVFSYWRRSTIFWQRTWMNIDTRCRIQNIIT